MKTRLTIFRFDSRDDFSPIFQEYELPFTQGMTVLEALRTIKADFEPTLEFRWECSQATCGTCGIMLNGKPVLSCQTLLEPNANVIVTPMSNFAVKKDLIVDLVPSLQRLDFTNPYLVLGNRTIQSKAEADASRKLRECSECGICVTVCPVPRDHSRDAADPLGMVKLARYHTDVRDSLDRRALAIERHLGLYECESCQRCVGLCPQGIDIPQEAILVLRAEKK